MVRMILYTAFPLRCSLHLYHIINWYLVLHVQRPSEQVYISEGRKYNQAGKVMFDAGIYEEEYGED